MNTGRDRANFGTESIVADIDRKLAAIALVPGQVRDIVPSRIRKELNDPDEANTILGDADHALRRLQTCTPTQQFAALL